MKLIIKGLSMVLLFIATLATSTISEGPGFTIRQTEEKVIYFDTKNYAPQALDIELQDKDGNVIFSEYVTTPGTFSRFYNLEELPAGTYSLLVKSNTTKESIPIVIYDDSLSIETNHFELVENFVRQ